MSDIILLGTLILTAFYAVTAILSTTLYGMLGTFADEMESGNKLNTFIAGVGRCAM